MAEPKQLNLEMRCGCGAVLLIDWPIEYASTLHDFMELAKAWSAGHKAHHVEPAKKAAP